MIEICPYCRKEHDSSVLCKDNPIIQSCISNGSNHRYGITSNDSWKVVDRTTLLTIFNVLAIILLFSSALFGFHRNAYATDNASSSFHLFPPSKELQKNAKDITDLQERVNVQGECVVSLSKEVERLSQLHESMNSRIEENEKLVKNTSRDMDKVIEVELILADRIDENSERIHTLMERVNEYHTNTQQNGSKK